MAQIDGYGFELPVAQAGQKYDIRPDVVVSAAAEAAVPFGRGVVRGTDPEKQVAVASADDDSFVGVSLFTHTKENQGFTTISGSPAAYTGGGAQYADGDAVSVLRYGACWVEVTAEVAAGDDVYVVVAAGDDQGKFTDVATDNLGPVGTFVTGAASGALAVVEVTKGLQGPQGPAGA